MRKSIRDLWRRLLRRWVKGSEREWLGRCPDARRRGE